MTGEGKTLDEMVSEIQAFFPGSALSEKQQQKLELLVEEYFQTRLERTISLAKAVAASVGETVTL